MNNNLFREKALKKVNSPDEISDYIKTSKKSVWVVFLAVIIFLLGVFIWSVFAKVEISISAVTVCENGKSDCYISENDIDRLSDDAYVKIEGNEYEIKSVSDLPILASDELSEYGLHLGDFENDEWVYLTEIETPLKDGIYKTHVVSECVSPISLLLN